MTTTYLKRADADVKALGGTDTASYDGIDLAEGEFIALVSVFNNVDTYGDVVMPGAFTDTIKAHEDAGDVIPVVWAHQWADPFAHIGHTAKAWQTDEGLMIHGALDLENPTAVQVHKLMKARRIRQFSFAYDIDEAAWGTRKAADGSDVDVYELRRLTLTEVGPCLKGVNRETDLRGVKGSPPPRDADAPTDPSPERKGDERPAPLTPAHVSAWAFTEELTNEE